MKTTHRSRYAPQPRTTGSIIQSGARGRTRLDDRLSRHRPAPADRNGAPWPLEQAVRSGVPKRFVEVNLAAIDEGRQLVRQPKDDRTSAAGA